MSLIPDSDISVQQPFTGAVSRTQHDKNTEIVSIQDAGALGGGNNDSNALSTSSAFTDHLLFNTDSVIKNVIINKPIILQGTASSSLSANAVNESNIIIAEPSDHNKLVENVTVIGMNFKDQPDTDNDNTSALHFNTVDAGIAAFNRFTNINTGIRVGYYLDGAVSRNNLQIGNTIVGAKTMGIELIQSKYNRTIGNVIHNNGIQLGLHGLRWSGNGIGNLAVGNSFRDRTRSGISLQYGNTHGVAIGNHFENIGQSAIQTNSTSNWAGKYFIGGLVAKNIGLDGFDLAYISSCFLQGLVDSCGGTGLRTDGSAAVGKHTIDLHVINAGNSGALIRSDKNLAKILIDANSAGTPILISGNYNLVIVLCADTTISNSLYISGNNNTVILQEAGTGSVGLRVDGNDNVVMGRVSGNISINGSRNSINCNSSGSLIISSTANSNIFSGYAFNITDNGVNSNFSGMIGGSAKGSGNFTTSTTGTITISHGLKRAPKTVLVTLNQDSPYYLTVINTTSTSFTVKAYDISAAGMPVVSTNLIVGWSASM